MNSVNHDGLKYEAKDNEDSYIERIYQDAMNEGFQDDQSLELQNIEEKPKSNNKS